MSKSLSFRILAVLCALSSVTACSKESTLEGKDIQIDGQSYHVEADKLVIGRECNYAPFNWTETKENENTLKISNAQGYADGYDIQIAKKLSEKRGREVEIVKELWESLVADCDN